MEKQNMFIYLPLFKGMNEPREHKGQAGGVFFFLWLDYLYWSGMLLRGKKIALNKFMGEKKIPGTWLPANDLTRLSHQEPNFHLEGYHRTVILAGNPSLRKTTVLRW